MNRVVISVTNDLVTDQRVNRTCECFDELGFDIILIGRKLKGSPNIKRPYKNLRLHLIFNKGFLFYAEYNVRLFFKLIVTKKSLLYANDLDTLLPNFLASKLSSCKLIYDSHEYFTEVPELISRPKTRSFWLRLEKFIFPKLKNIITVNQKIADLYSSTYKVPITVVKNVAASGEIKDFHALSELKKQQPLILYQGALNTGRGLELIIDTMAYMNQGTLVIAGEGDITDQLKKRVVDRNLEERVIFLGRVIPNELKSITKIADLGISLEEDIGLNYRYCLPNKVFDYIEAGIPVLVSNLPLLKELIQTYDIGQYVTIRDPKSLSLQIEKILNDKNKFDKGIHQARVEFNWEKEKKTLIEFIDRIE